MLLILSTDMTITIPQPQLASRLQKIDVTVMRAGTSKGIFLKLEDVPAEREERLAFLEQLMGSDAAQMDGIGGGNVLSSKIALVSKSEEPDIDIDYKFVQVVPGRGIDDTFSCGNLMSAVAPFAVDCGLVKAGDPETTVTVRDVNNHTQAAITIQTPGGKTNYIGDVELSGSAGSASPIKISYSKLVPNPDKMWPSGKVINRVNDLPVSYINAVVPVLIFSSDELSVDLGAAFLRQRNSRELIENLLNARDEFMEELGTGILRKSIRPKIAIVSPPIAPETTMSVRYFTPHTPHRSIAVTGAIAIAAASVVPGSVPAKAAAGIEDATQVPKQKIVFEHLTGKFELEMEYAHDGEHIYPVTASLVRTARLLIQGTAFVPSF